MQSLVAASPLENVNTLTLALLLAWVLSVCLHEFAHALVAYLGGDDSVRARGYLALDPSRYIDPISTLLIPAIILLVGGFPLPGGAVLIDHSRLRSDRWRAAVSAAGPAANLLIFLLIVIVLHPRLGLVDPFRTNQPNWVYFLGALAVLQFIAVLFNLIPLPPLDGFGIIEHRLDPETRWKLRQPHSSFACLAILVFLLWTFPPFWRLILRTFVNVVVRLGAEPAVFLDGYSIAFTGSK